MNLMENYMTLVIHKSQLWEPDEIFEFLVSSLEPPKVSGHHSADIIVRSEQISEQIKEGTMKKMGGLEAFIGSELGINEPEEGLMHSLLSLQLRPLNAGVLILANRERRRSAHA